MAGEVKASTKTDNREFVNLLEKAEGIPQDKQEEIVEMANTDYENDDNGRSGWKEDRDRYYKLWLLDVGQDRATKSTGKNTPWRNASNVCIPMLSTAVNQFHGRAYQSIFSAPEILHALPMSKNDIRRASNVESYMNFQLMYEMIEYEEVFDKTLLNLPINGTAFKKFTYKKPLDRPESDYISALDLVLPYGSKSLESAPRLTQIVRLSWDELLDRNEQGLYQNFDQITERQSTEDEASDSLNQTADKATGQQRSVDTDNPHIILERHSKYDLGDGRKPYIFTIHKESKTLLRVVSREFDVGATKKTLDYFIDYHFIPNSEGFYSFGFGHFLEVLNEMGNTAFNQIFDAGRLTNHPFFFYGRRAGFKKKTIELNPGKGYEVEDSSQINFPQMQRLDSVLFSVLGLINTYASNFTSVTENTLGREQQGVERPTARGTLALIEQGLTPFAIIVKRIRRAMAKEFRLVKLLDEIFLPDSKEFRIGGSRDKIAFSDIKKEDFGGVKDIVPVADPMFASKQARKQEALQLHELTMRNPIVIGTPAPKEGGEPAIKPNLRAMFEATRNLYSSFEEPRTAAFLSAIEESIPPQSTPPDEENAMVMQGDIPVPTAQDNHVQHLQAHIAFTNTEEYKELPDEYKELLQLHIAVTRTLAEAQIAEQQAQAQAQAQAPPTPAGGAPGGLQ